MIVCIILCFSIVFLSVDFFSGGKLIRAVYSTMVKTKYDYYFVAASYPTREKANAGVLLAEKTGGAGYLVSEDGAFTVVLGVYTGEEDAKKVVEKNKATFVYAFSFSSSDTDLSGTVDKFVKEGVVILEKIDAGAFGDNTLRTFIDTYSVIFASFEREETEKKSFLSFVLSCLEGLDPGTTDRTSLLFQTRHMLCAVLFAARDALSG